MVEIRSQLQRCLDRFHAGTLSAEDLQAAVDLVDRPATQSILYIQTPTTQPHDIAIGMSIFEEGKDEDGVDENGEFLYRSVKEALQDGWRIVKFPGITPGMDDQNAYGLGFEFVLERWR
ncbi:MAG: hypothetical protein CMJ18_20080 [Phycisphaeraceae bacterium]|nr:hypothetical protein [Phycisphaeraceae bacterium]